MVFVKKSTFFHMFFFWAKKSHKETFFDILDRKECFLDHKRKLLKKSKKNRHFAKGLIHGFCQKVDLFLICFFFLAKNARKKHFLIFWIEIKAFWTSKVKFSKSRKKSTFCKGVNPWFWSKNRPFSYMFSLEQKKARKKEFLIFWIEKNAF